MDGLTWDDLPEFNWCDIYCKLAWGLDDPSWAGYNKKTKNKWRRERVAEAERALREQEAKHNLPAGSLLGEGGAGAAPCASPAEEGVPPPPPGTPSAEARALAPPPPPPTQPPPDVAAKRLFDDDGTVRELPSVVFGGRAAASTEAAAASDPAGEGEAAVSSGPDRIHYTVQGPGGSSLQACAFFEPAAK